MAKILCALKNASTLINGVKFIPTDGGMISEDIDQDVAENFSQIKGYSLVTDEESAPAASADPAAPATTTPKAPAPKAPAKAPAAKTVQPK